MSKQSTNSILAVGAALLLVGTAAFSGLAEAQFKGDVGPPGGRSGPPPSGGKGGGGGGGGGGGAGPKAPSPITKPAPEPGAGPKAPPPGFKPSPGFKPGPPGAKPPPPGFKPPPPVFRPPPPPPPRHRPRPPGVRFWYWSGIPIFATDYDGCGYEYYKWRTTSSTYWRNKFYQCIDDED